MTERERIIAGFSPAEREIYERLGGKVKWPQLNPSDPKDRRYAALVESVRCEAVPRWFAMERKRKQDAAA